MENINKPHTPIKQWAEDDRPREKMLQQGASSLSKSELLAILINNGTRSRSAMELARDLLNTCNSNIHLLAKLSIADIQKVKGIGPAKAVTIKAALELGIRKETDRISMEKMIFKTSESAADYLQFRLQDKAVEVFAVIYLNKGQRLLEYQELSTGGITGTVVDVRNIARKAVELGATSVVIAHNHPSGNLHPSEQDKVLTKKIKQGLQMLDITLVDHIIISDEGYYSFQDSGGF
jgi:DNA repair protein RadC